MLDYLAVDYGAAVSDGRIIDAGEYAEMEEFSRSAGQQIGRFFAISSALIAVLAVVLVSKGVAALQEAGMLDVTPLALPRVDLLGIYPSWQTLAAQGIVLLVILASFGFNLQTQKKLPV